MKFIKYSILFFLVLISCNETLDVVPDQRLEIDNLEKLEATLVAAYQNERSFRFTHFSSDDAGLVKNYSGNQLILEDLYTWRRDIRDQTHQDSPSSFWTTSYKAIAQTNLVLEQADLITPISNAEKNKLKLITAEAKLVRSYNHFMLVNIFSKHYDVSTASKDLGVPYVEKVEDKIRVDYTRNTVEEVYNKAEIDLLEAISTIEKLANDFDNNKYRFTLATMYAYASRFYTFRNKDVKDQDKVILYATKSLDNFQGANNLRQWSDYNSNKFSLVDINRSEVGLVQRADTWLSIDNVYQLNNEIRDKYLGNPLDLPDDRFLIYYTRSGNIFIPINYFVFVQDNGERIEDDIFPLSEVILNKAEAHIRKEEYESAAVLLKIIGQKCYKNYNSNLLTTQKLKTYYKVGTDKEAWTAYLLHERRLMLLLRGFRWFDIKRYNIEVTHKLSNGNILKLSDVAPNKDYQIPSYAISNGMTPNN